ncbi:hypothetical protein [Pseudonocardia sp. HH130629-09]|nr:hypothetical protein [Pseudonocardia sp. HH130629-09]
MSSARPRTTEGTAETVVDALRDAIAAGEVVPDQRLIEADLSE